MIADRNTAAHYSLPGPRNLYAEYRANYAAPYHGECCLNISPSAPSEYEYQIYHYPNKEREEIEGYKNGGFICFENLHNEISGSKNIYLKHRKYKARGSDHTS